MGERTKTSLDDERDALAHEVTTALDKFMNYEADQERAAGLGEVYGLMLEAQSNGEELFSAEEYVAEVDPQQLIEALKLEEVLAKLHGCIIKYWLWKRVGVEYKTRVLEDGSLVSEEVVTVDNAYFYVMEVRSHSVRLLPEWQKWMVSLDLAPVIGEDSEQFTLPLNEFYGLEVLALKSEL